MSKENTSYVPKNNLTVDLGLFNQLLQMVDGDWSDSIQGICDHILSKVNASIITMSILDKNYNEFIYIAYSISESTKNMLDKNNIKYNQKLVLNNFMNVLSRKTDIDEITVLKNEELNKFATVFFNDRKLADKLIDELNIKSAFIIPGMLNHKDFNCYFHIMVETDSLSIGQEAFDDYIAQLNLALEIIFLMRELYIKATHDGLTKLFNHKQGEILLMKEIERVQRNKQPLTIVMLDIDFFKKVNDTYGHTTGDLVLQYIGDLLSTSLRKCDIISRYGGEEFLLVLPDTELKNSVDVISRIKDTIENHKFKSDNSEFSVTASFGIAQYSNDDNNTSDEFINMADKNLYKAKNNGRNRIEY